MAYERTYGQFCALARALDHVGDRWTLLVVRELLPGPRRYAELLAGLPGVASNLLAERLRRLEEDGLVRKSGGRTGAYELTTDGRELEEAVGALVRWGARWMRGGPGGDAFDPRWADVALRALLPGRGGAAVSGAVDLHFDGHELGVRVRRGSRSVGAPAGERADSIVTARATTFLAVADGALPLAEAVRVAGAVVTGDGALAQAAVEPLGPQRGA